MQVKGTVEGVERKPEGIRRKNVTSMDRGGGIPKELGESTGGGVVVAFKAASGKRGDGMRQLPRQESYDGPAQEVVLDNGPVGVGGRLGPALQRTKDQEQEKEEEEEEC